jgi:hypothetical protein
MDKWLGILRHVATSVGAIAVAFGVADADQVNTVVTNIQTIGGAVLVIGSVVASVLAKRNSKVEVVVVDKTNEL